MRKFALLFALPVIFMACTPSNDPGPEPSLRASNRIAVARNNDGAGTSRDIYMIIFDDPSSPFMNNFKRITTIGESTTNFLDDPCWGAKGKIYFTSKHQGEAGRQIYVVDSSGGPVTRITNSSQYEYSYLNYSWTMDRLVYVKSKLGSGEVVIANIKTDGGDEKIITSAPNSIHPSFNSDGSRVVYASPELPSSTQSTPNNIYIANLDGSNKQKVTNTNNLVYEFPHVSPDGGRLAYSINDSVYIAKLDGTGVEKTPLIFNGVRGWRADGIWLLLQGLNNDVFMIKNTGPTAFTLIQFTSTKDCFEPGFN